MNDSKKTLLFVAAAVAAVVLAWFTRPEMGQPEQYSDQGEPFFAEFQNPDQAMALEVVEWDAKLSTPRPFRVQQKNGRWTIPSHHGYPADAKDEMAKAAGLVIGLTKDGIRSDDPSQHKELGVLDPTDPGIETEGRGTLVKFEDASGNALASLIIGKEIEGRAGMRYVRLPGVKRTYVAKLADVPSTNFADWIEKDLLEAPSFDLQELVFDSYSIDEVTGTRVPGDYVVAKRKEYDWTLDGLAETEEPNQDKLRDVAYAVSDLQIVGVRPKPAGLSRDLTRAEGIELAMDSVLSLQSRGFFLGRDGTLYANEGDLIAKTKKGVAYTLRFGEVLYGEGEAVTAGVDGPKPEAAADPAAGEGEAAGENKDDLKANRFLMITAHFDEKLIEQPAGEVLPKDELDRRKTARTAMEKVVAAINTYKDKNDGKLPESLQTLTEGDDPPLQSLDKDPWGHDLQVRITNGDEPMAVVVSFGADGVEGGTGANADLASDNWKHEDDLQKAFTDHEAYNKTLQEGRDLAKKMTERFAPWYYVISEENFKKLHATRADLVKEKSAKDEDAAADHDHAGDETGGDAGDADSDDADAEDGDEDAGGDEDSGGDR